VQVAQLGQCVPHRVVDRTLADLAAFDVRDGNAQAQRHRRGGEQLVTIGDEQQQVRSHPRQDLGQAERGHTDRLGHPDVAVGAEQALDALVDPQAVVLDFSNGLTELPGQLRADDDQTEIDLRVGVEIVQDPAQMAVVGPRGGDDGDGSTHSGLNIAVIAGSVVSEAGLARSGRRPLQCRGSEKRSDAPTRPQTQETNAVAHRRCRRRRPGRADD